MTPDPSLLAQFKATLEATLNPAKLRAASSESLRVWVAQCDALDTKYHDLGLRDLTDQFRDGIARELADRDGRPELPRRQQQGRR